jgi:hypothetical protein
MKNLNTNNKDKIKSEFFNFDIAYKKDKNFIVSFFRGWNSSLIVQIEIKKGYKVNCSSLYNLFPKIRNKEKILVLSAGSIRLLNNRSEYKMKIFDAANFYIDNDISEIDPMEDSIIYIVSAENLSSEKGDTLLFNFKDDLTPKEIWGGKCVSRPFQGKNLNLVLFDLKEGFEFRDEGHSNEQITWLIDGKMDFYCNGDLKEELIEKKGVDVGALSVHGGFSRGALGFDAFFPKRNQEEYRQTVNFKKF